MVAAWMKPFLTPRAGCGPLCRSIQAEVESIGRAEALARQSKKKRNRQRGQRGE